MEKILGKTGEDILRPEDIMTLAVSRSAGRKCVTDEMEYQVILNQADTEEEKQTAMQLAEDIGKKLSEKYISEKNTKDTEFSGSRSASPRNIGPDSAGRKMVDMSEIYKNKKKGIDPGIRRPGYRRGCSTLSGGLSGDHDGYCSAAYRKKGSGDVQSRL